MSGDVEGKISFGPFELRPGERALAKEGRTVRLGARAFDILLALTDRAGEILSQNELCDRVWPNTHVGDTSLRVQVRALRKALGDGVDGARYVTNIPGRGYSFTAPITRGKENPPREPETAAPIKAAPLQQRTNLPTYAGAFFGRDAEIAALAESVVSRRLTTLVGMGGIGKTRLTVELGRQVHDRFPDGVWFIDLASLSSAATLASATAIVLGVSIPNTATALDAIAAAIGQRTMLLIFDNCEHLAGAVAEMVETLLKAAPLLSVVTGSQTRLRLADEYVYRVEPLDLPPPDATEIDAFSAVALFVARAAANDRSFRLGPATIGQVGEICRRLEGIPLALEMAAARVSLLGLKGLLTGLDERLRMLKFDSGRTEARHRTLRAMVDWSYGLLDPAEQGLFQRLAIFAGSFSLDAAIGVAEIYADRWEIVDLLAQLIDKSLVTVETGDVPRYRLLETLRLLGLEQLQASGDHAAVARCHAAYYTALFDQSDAEWETTPIAAWTERYRAEADNARAALAWAFDDPDRAAIAVTLVGSATRLLRLLNLGGEAKSYVQRALSLADDRIDPVAVARLLFHAGSIWRGVDRARALAFSEQSIALYRQHADPEKLGAALAVHGVLLAFLGRVEEAEHALLEAKALLFPGRCGKAQIAVLSNLAILATSKKQPLQAREWYSQALDLALALDEISRIDYLLVGLAEVDFVLGDIDSAVDRARRAVANARSRDFEVMTPITALTNLASYLIVQGKLSDARPAAREALLLTIRDGGFQMTVCLEIWALIGALDGHHRIAAELIGFVDAHYARSGNVRQPTEQTLHDLLHQTLSANLSPAAIEAYAADGSRWSDQYAARTALDRLVSGAG